MGSFPKITALLNEVTYNADKSIARDKKLAAAHSAKMSKGMDAVMGFEKQKTGHKRTSQLTKIKRQGGGRGTGAQGAHNAKRGIGDSSEIASILKSLKESYESGLITEKAFLALANPILERFGSAGSARDNPPGQPKKGEKPDKAPWGGKGPKKKKGLKKIFDNPSKLKPSDRG